MAYNNRNYSNRGNNQRFNSSGGRYSTSENLSNQHTPSRNPRATAAALNSNYSNLYESNASQQQPYKRQYSPPAQTQDSPPTQQPSPPLPDYSEPNPEMPIKNEDEKASMMVDALVEDGMDGGSEKPDRPAWMKPKGVMKKVSMKERRRRQNENLRRLITPKNALMVLNEMMPGEACANQFKVEPFKLEAHMMEQSTSPAETQRLLKAHFLADLTVEGQLYKGFGENKLTARNNAADSAIRDLILRRMSKALGADPMAEGSTNGEGAEEEPLPMIQLASYALHKLFAEWEAKGHKVPQLQRTTSQSISEAGSEVSGPVTPKAKPPKKPKELPEYADTMHPCMLLTHMRPRLEYTELGSEGDKPQNTVFTMGVNVDGTTYIGKASNKKEARKLAARAACQAIFNVQFKDTASSMVCA